MSRRMALLKSIATIGSFTMISRVLGLAREILLANVVGPSLIVGDDKKTVQASLDVQFTARSAWQDDDGLILRLGEAQSRITGGGEQGRGQALQHLSGLVRVGGKDGSYVVAL